MFGFDCAFVNGQMFSGLFEDRMMVRLDDAEREELLAMPGAMPFEPMPGRPMREYAVVPPALVAARPRLGPWVARAFAYAVALPTKTKKKRAPAPKTTTKARRPRRR
jgi:TfoX/Sxy family transcriptional regulator of competence genes